MGGGWVEWSGDRPQRQIAHSFGNKTLALGGTTKGERVRRGGRVFGWEMIRTTKVVTTNKEMGARLPH